MHSWTLFCWFSPRWAAAFIHEQAETCTVHLLPPDNFTGHFFSAPDCQHLSALWAHQTSISLSSSTTHSLQPHYVTPITCSSNCDDTPNIGLKRHVWNIMCISRKIYILYRKQLWHKLLVWGFQVAVVTNTLRNNLVCIEKVGHMIDRRGQDVITVEPIHFERTRANGDVNDMCCQWYVDINIAMFSC